jgi:aconitate hydratase 2/2-methylisocitrate dehydratase
VLGKLPTVEEYMAFATKIDSMAPEIYRYLNFDKMPAFVESAQRGQEVVLKLAI